MRVRRLFSILIAAALVPVLFVGTSLGDSDPDATISAGPANGSTVYLTQTPSFSFSGNGDTASFECRVDGAAFAACSSPFTTPILSDGAHSFEVRGLDSTGTPEVTPDARNFSVNYSSVAYVESGVIKYFAISGQTNNLSASPTTGAYSVIDTSATLAAGPGCSQVSSGQVNCASAGVTSMEISAGDGNDSITTNAVYGYTFTLPQTWDGGPGDDTIKSGPTTGSNLLIGGDGNDTLSGTATRPDVMSGGDGTDTVTFQNLPAATVSIDGIANDGALAEGDDVQLDVENVTGSSSADTLIGSSGANVLTGGSGNDTLDGGSGADTLTGGTGVDTATYANRVNPVQISNDANANDGESGEGDRVSTDTEVLIGGSANDTLTSFGNADRLDGHFGNDVLSGGPNDHADYSRRTSRVVVTLDSTANDGDPLLNEQDNVIGTSGVYGGSGDDTITGNSTANVLYGQAGNDVISGLAGNDLFNGDGGDDTIDGGTGGDTVYGGTGVDTADFSARTSPLTITTGNNTANDGQAGESDNIRSDIEVVRGGSANDTISGGAAADTLDGGAGRDTLDGLAGNDTLLVRDGLHDEVVCGSGVDVVTADTFDISNADCESIDSALVIDTYFTSGPVAGSTLLLHPELPNYVTSYAFEFDSGTESFECRVDAEPFAACVSPYVVPVLSVGSHEFQVRAVDSQGNPDPTPATRQVTVARNSVVYLDGDVVRYIAVAGENNNVTLSSGTVPSGLSSPPTTTGSIITDTATQPAAGPGCTVMSATQVGCPNYFAASVAISTGDGNDSVTAGTGTMAQTIDVGEGDDSLITTQSAPTRALFGGPGNDIVRGDKSTSEVVSGGDGIDTVEYTYLYFAGVSVSLDDLDNDGLFGYETDNVMTDVENVVGTGYGDTLTGSDSANVLNGGHGDDSLDGGLGADTFQGGTGSDTVTYAPRVEELDLSIDGLANDGANDENDNIGTDVENLVGGDNNDSIVGSAGANTIRGGPGDDSVTPSPGDVLNGGSGVDTVDISSYSAAATMSLDGVDNDSHGNAATDFENLIGGSGNDTLTGNSSANEITGGPGSDTVDGSAGDDTLLLRDGIVDQALCSDGTDQATVDLVDALFDCETVNSPQPASITAGPAEGATITTETAEFAFTASAPATFDCRVDGGAWVSPCQSPWTTPVLSDGAHSFSVRAVDTVGDVDQTPVVRNFVVETASIVIPEAPTLISTPANPTNQTSAAFSIGFQEGNTLECSLDAQAFAPCSSTPTFSDLVEGAHFFSVRQINAVGTGPSTDFNWTVDLTPPDAPNFTNVTEDITVGNEITVDWTPTEDGFMKCRPLGGEWTECSPPFHVGSLEPGQHTYGFKWQDDAGNVTLEFDHTWTLLPPPPPADPVVTSSPSGPTNATTASIAFSQSEGHDVECSLDQATFTPCESPFVTSGLLDGTHTLSLRAVSGSQYSSTVGVAWTVDTVAPAPPAITAAPDVEWAHSTSTFEFTGEAGAQFRCKLAPQAFKPCASPRSYELLDQGQHHFEVRQIDEAGNTSTASTFDWNVTVGPETAPPDAPAIDQTTVTPFADRVDFLYSGPDAIQQGVAEGAIADRRVAVIRGDVRTTTNQPLPGVRVSVVGHPELGASLSRDDGEVYLAVNGGGKLTLRLEKDGYLAVDRAVDVPWRDYAFFDDVVMTTLDPGVSEVELGGGMQVAEGSTVADVDGQRRATVLFPEGTTAQMRFPDGEIQPLTDLDVRITEFTVGENGPDAMPAALPATTAYTYASEFTVDQAIAAGAESVEFSQPVWGILENFIGLPAGTVVPNGYYDRNIPGWTAQSNGNVMKVLSVSNGVATLDDGNGQPMETPPASDPRHASWNEMMEYVGSRFAPGETFWMMPMKHFSPFDWNLAFAFPWDWELPPSQSPTAEDEKDSCKMPGSIIECENQTLGESFDIPGTGMSLNYRSDRAPGRTQKSRFTVNLSDSEPSPSLESIELTIDIEGVRYEHEFTPEPNAKFVFDWDGLDWAGRQLVGTHTARVTLNHLYPVWLSTWAESGTAWSRVSGSGSALDMRRDGAKLVTPQVFEVQLEAPVQSLADWKTESVAGWELSPHHRFDPAAQTTLRGDGTREHPDELGKTFSRFAGVEQSGGGGGEENSAIGPPFDADAVASLRPVSLLRPLISMLPLAAVGAPDETDPFGIGDGGPARDAALGEVTAVAVGDDGSVFAAERVWNSQQEQSAARIRRIDPDGVISTVAGNGENGENGDGGPAVDAQISSVTDLAVGHQGEIYFIQGNRVRRVGADGSISNFAGQIQGGGGLPVGDEGPAADARLNDPLCLAVGADGSLYVCDTSTSSIRHVDLSGIITTVSDLPVSASESMVPRSMIIDRDGVIYVGGDYRLLRVDPISYAVTVHENLFEQPTLNNPCVADLGLAPDKRVYMLVTENFSAGCERRTGYVYLSHPRDGMQRLVSADGGNPDLTGPNAGYARAIGGAPNGDLYSGFPGAIWHYGAAFTDHMPQGVTVPDPSGDVAHSFDAAGRHLNTISTTTGATLTSFTYDGENRLTGVIDADGNTTTIERNAAGVPTAIVAPFGQRTELSVGPDGLLSSVESPGGRTLEMTYDSKGLLQTFTKPNGATSTFTYDGVGRLLTDEDASGSTQTLEMDGDYGDYSVTLSSAAGREKVVSRKQLADGGTERTIQNPSGTVSHRVERTDGSKSVTLGDGTVIHTTSLPDDRYGSSVQVPSTATITTPGGRSAVIDTSVEHDEANWWDPFSWNTETSSTSVNGRTSTSVLDKNAKSIESTSSAGRTSSSTFDDDERPLTLNVPGFAQVSYSYDANGRMTQASQGSRTSTVTYNAGGRIESTTDPLGRSTQYAYDADGLVTSTTLPGGREVQFSYDNNGNMTSLTPPSRPAHEFSYDILGLMTGATAPEASSTPRTTAYQYGTLDHDLTEITRPSGAQAQLSYDSGGRIDGMITPDGTTSLTYNSATGKPSSISGPGGQQIAFEYDGPLPTSHTMTGPIAGSSSLSYNNEFQLISANAAGSQIGFTYDADGLLTGAGDLLLGRDADNGVVNAVTLSALATSFSYDQYGDPTSIDTDYMGGDVHNVSFTRDAGGRIVTKQETAGAVTTTWAYNYNAAGQLENVMNDGVQYAAYTYDQNGNRTSKTDSSGTTLATFDARDRMVTSGDLDLAYNENGELIEKQNRVNGDTLSLEYTTLGDLKSATTVDDHEIDYVLDPLGRRVGKRVDGDLVQGLLYSPEAFGPVAELDENNDLVSRFVYTGSHVPAYMIKNGTTYRLVTDQLGSVMMVVDTQTGAVAQEITYGPFGEVLSDSNPSFQPFGFAGGIYDVDTGLAHYGAREYDAEIGRWTAADPIGFNAGDSNLYGYVVQDPVNFVDPTGLFRIFGHRVTPTLQEASDFSAGFGDTVTLGGTDWIRERMGVNGVVNKCSGWYTAGGYAGSATTAVLGGASVRAAYNVYKFNKAWGYGTHAGRDIIKYRQDLIAAQFAIGRVSAVAGGYSVAREVRDDLIDEAMGRDCEC